MDRNTLVGIALIVGLFLLYGTLTGDDDAKEKKSQSEKARTEAPAAAPQPTAPVPQAADSAELSKRYGPYAALRSGGVQKVEVKTEDLHLLFTNKGGVPEAIYLNKHKTYDGAPLPVLPTGPKNSFSFTLPYNGNVLSTQDLFFSYQGPDSLSLKGSEQKTLRFRAQLDSASYLEYVYSLKGRGYDLDWEVRLINMRNYVQANRLELLSGLEIPKTEKDAEKMLPNANLVYALAQDEGVEVNHLDVSADEEVEEELNYSTKWVSFKSQFFQLALIAQDKFEGGGILRTKPLPQRRHTEAIKYMQANVALPYSGMPKEVHRLTLYAGPNNINILDAYGVSLDKTVRLGWGPLRYVTLFIIGVFHTLEGMTASYGLIILILAIFIKLILLPLTLKSHKSMVKMQIVNQMPEMKELEARYKDNATELQQRKMSFYRQVGVSPFGGCLPMLLQFPVLIAMFNFFPESIELRQQGLWWAEDLSTYDSIWDFGYVPILNTIYGDHVSLFTLLMTISTLVYTYMQQQMQGNTSMAGAPNMKWMGYLMPILFLGILNNYAAALSYYYLIFNLLTIAQTYILKAAIDKKKLEDRVHATKAKGPKKAKGRVALWMEKQQKKQEALARSRRQAAQPRTGKRRK